MIGGVNLEIIFTKKLCFLIFGALILLVSIVLVILKPNPNNYSLQEASGAVSQLDSNYKVNDNFSEESKAEESGEKTFDEKLLLEEAKKQNIKVNDTYVDDLIKKNLEAYKVDKEELNKNLQEAGISYEQFKEELSSKIMISELINKNVDLKSVKVSDKEVDNFIEKNKEDFQEFFNNEDDMEALKSRIKLKLLRDKQTDLVRDYVNTLTVK